ncbi:MAG: RIP metalloprotease RseP [Candidatus Omnitrophica bacterium]|nr:RIP metalloprotease RseP [Candidatus Omnitrophota bacterium]
MIEFLIHTIPTVLILGILIFIHELGHFLACRLARVGVEKFSIGFGPELVSWKGKETRYVISLIPFGGFVKPKGETYDEIKERGEEPDPHDFVAASKTMRFLILVAGVAMNYLFAYLLFVSVMLAGRPVLAPKIGGFIEGYPAQVSGLQVGDQVTHLNGTSISNWQDLTIQILEGGGETLHFSVMRKGEPKTIRVVPQVESGHDIFGKLTQVPRIGIKPTDEFTVERFTLTEALRKSAQFEWRLTALTYEALWHLVTGKLSLKTISGPIGIISMAGNAAQMGVVALLQFTAILSVSLAVINLLPIPALDGGHLFFLFLEVILRKPISIKFQERLTQVGFYFLMSLMLLVVYNDLVNIGAVEKIKNMFFPSG